MILQWHCAETNVIIQSIITTSNLFLKEIPKNIFSNNLPLVDVKNYESNKKKVEVNDKALVDLSD